MTAAVIRTFQKESSAGPLQYSVGEFVVVKVHGKTKYSFQVYVMRIASILDNDCIGMCNERDNVVF